MKLELERGSFGYIKKKKMRQIIYMIFFIFMSAVILVTGLFIHNFERANIFTVMSILMVLPMVKMLVTYILLFPYKSVPEDTYNMVKDTVCDNAIVMTDMVITSPEKPMNLDFVIIMDNQLIGVRGNKKQDAAYIEGFLKESLKNNKIEGFTVKVFEDYKPFLSSITRYFEKAAKQDECFRYIRTLVV